MTWVGLITYGGPNVTLKGTIQASKLKATGNAMNKYLNNTTGGLRGNPRIESRMGEDSLCCTCP